MRPSRGQNQGFTLAELLVATMLLSIVMGSLYTMTHGTLSAWRSLEDGSDAYREARTALAVFRRELDNQLPGAAPLFKGDANELTMYVVSEPLKLSEAEGARMMEVRYYVKRENRTLTLMRDETIKEGVLSETLTNRGMLSVDSRMKTVGKTETFLMASNLKSFQFSYVWFPAPDKIISRLEAAAVEMIVLPQHRENWGMPQGIEVEMVVEDPENPEEGLVINTTFPVRGPSARRNLGSIMKLGGN